MALRSPRGPHAFSSSSILSLTQPFTPNALKLVRNALGRVDTKSSSSTDTGATNEDNAAVLIPFCNVRGKPGVLLELRAKSLRSHSGEVSFPGGRFDDTDASFMDAALRETHEELGIHPDRVDVLGEIGPPEMNLRGDMRVWPYVGFVHAVLNEQLVSDDDPLPSIDIESIRDKMSQSEVAAVFHLPLAELTSPLRMRSYTFRGQRPYWATEVTDLVAAEGTSVDINPPDDAMVLKDEVGCGKGGRVEVWGLTGWYLSVLMKTLGVYR